MRAPANRPAIFLQPQPLLFQLQTAITFCSAVAAFLFQPQTAITSVRLPQSLQTTNRSQSRVQATTVSFRHLISNCNRNRFKVH